MLSRAVFMPALPQEAPRPKKGGPGKKRGRHAKEEEQEEQEEEEEEEEETSKRGRKVSQTLAVAVVASGVTRHTSHLTPHTSHLTPHTSHLTPHTSHLTPHTSLSPGCACSSSRQRRARWQRYDEIQMSARVCFGDKHGPKKAAVYLMAALLNATAAAAAAAAQACGSRLAAACWWTLEGVSRVDGRAWRRKLTPQLR
jgi:hypothetical protein